MLSPYFQPIFDLKICEPYGFEGLIRGPRGSLLHMPTNLLDVAMGGGLYREFEHACIQSVLGTWPSALTQYRIFVNLSPNALLDMHAQGSIERALFDQTGLLPRNVVFELTESQPTFDYALLLEAVEHLRSLGFTIALDDVGQGFSSLRLWSELKPEFVKVDKYFVQNLSSDPRKFHFLRSIQDLAHRTGARVVAEGIETVADLTVLREMGIDFGQGFLLGMPAPQPDQRTPQHLIHLS